MNTESNGPSGPRAEDLIRFWIEQNSAEQARGETLEKRGITVITTTATLLTILLALVAVVTQTNSAFLPRSTVLPLVSSLIAFIAGAIFGTIVNMLTLGPRETRTMGVSTVESIVDVLIHQVSRTRSVNRVKAFLVFWALVGQVLGLLLLAVTITTVVLAISD